MDCIELTQLDPQVAYCVIRDNSPQARESILVMGSKILREALSCSDLQKFRPNASLGMNGYVRIRVNDTTHLGIWADPTRPELMGGETENTKMFHVETINAVPREFSLTELLQRSAKTLLASLE